MMMFSPCVFCVLPCVTSTFTVSKLARIIKQASRVGGVSEFLLPYVDIIKVNDIVTGFSNRKPL